MGDMVSFAMTGVMDEDLIVSDRGGIIENKHTVHAAIVDSQGNLLYSVGNPSRMTLIRSSAKPFQTVAILETGAADKFHWENEDIALLCASHSSEPKHISRARNILKKAGVAEGVLACGGHPALNATVNREWIKEDYIPTAICNNCSGKHAGMAAGAISLGEKALGYQEFSHPMQRRVRRVVEEMSDLSEDKVLWAVDGCNLPTPALSLKKAAMMYARLAEARDTKDIPSKREEHLARIHESMSSHPDLVGGEGRFCTLLMEAFDGAVVGKIGADACYGVSVRAAASSLGQAIGIAVKVEDGNLDMVYSAVVQILHLLDIGAMEIRQQLDRFWHPAIINTAGVVTGRVTHQFQVKRVMAT
ncbi:thermolabile L-asparaginase [Amniculicola lignicola CBS 123094]|uniref:Thermolabile L-asparaginase n=1 Tax=Amniculicola lignicola CBS 123094 TaxID=1392246 RepID=A0A6A5WJP8_9PLEO|nr:thermolabile L-asparaginase [Amniculicola lignicola CBS 123094]